MRGKYSSVLLAVVLAAGVAVPASASAAAPTTAFEQLVPEPASVRADPGTSFALTPTSVISYDIAHPETRDVAGWLAGHLRPSTGYPLPVVPATRDLRLPGITLLLGGVDPSAGDEGYRLDVTGQGVLIQANTAHGAYDGVQTLLQLLPAKAQAATRQPGPWPVPGGHIADRPRYSYRGAMLDVARHFFTVADVKRYIDEISRFKVNYLQLHLTDSQGWRIQIDGWPRLTEIGGSSSVDVGGVRAGYYTQADYREIVRYAARNFVTIVPEIEGPAHSNAALSSYAELNCDGVAPPLYHGAGASPNGNLCLSKEVTYTLLDNVIRQVAAMTPGPYVSIGGDEAAAIPAADYATYIRRVQGLVTKYGKKLMGWQEMMAAAAPADTLGQLWAPGVNVDDTKAAATHGAKMVMAPAFNVYLDMKYAADIPSGDVGNDWAGYLDVKDMYDWDPTTVQDGVPATAVAGVSAPLFTELVYNPTDIDELAFPRLPAVAELGWSPAAEHDWDSFRIRLAAQGPRWVAAGVKFTRSAQIPWPSDVAR